MNVSPAEQSASRYWSLGRHGNHFRRPVLIFGFHLVFYFLMHHFFLFSFFFQREWESSLRSPPVIFCFVFFLNNFLLLLFLSISSFFFETDKNGGRHRFHHRVYRFECCFHSGTVGVLPVYFFKNFNDPWFVLLIVGASKFPAVNGGKQRLHGAVNGPRFVFVFCFFLVYSFPKRITLVSFFSRFCLFFSFRVLLAWFRRISTLVFNEARPDFFSVIFFHFFLFASRFFPEIYIYRIFPWLK